MKRTELLIWRLPSGRLCGRPAIATRSDCLCGSESRNPSLFDLAGKSPSLCWSRFPFKSRGVCNVVFVALQMKISYSFIFPEFFGRECGNWVEGSQRSQASVLPSTGRRQSQSRRKLTSFELRINEWKKTSQKVRSKFRSSTSLCTCPGPAKRKRFKTRSPRTEHGNVSMAVAITCFLLWFGRSISRKLAWINYCCHLVSGRFLTKHIMILEYACFIFSLISYHQISDILLAKLVRIICFAAPFGHTQLHTDRHNSQMGHPRACWYCHCSGDSQLLFVAAAATGATNIKTFILGSINVYIYIYNNIYIYMLSAPTRTYLLWIHLTWTTPCKGEE